MNNSYPFKHWFSTLIVSALVILAIDIISANNTLNDAVGIFVLFIIYGLFFSLPVFILYLILFSVLIRKINSEFMIKTILNATTICGVFITIKLIGGSMMTPKLALFYSVALIVCSFIFKIKKQNAADT
jgi:Sec-independent protein secretion pathway component TatC